MSTSKQWIAIGTINVNCITMAVDSAFTKGVSNINKEQIVSVQQVFTDLTVPGMENLRAKYRFPYIMRILIKMSSTNDDYTFECQTVQNQATWNVTTDATTAEASLTQANKDISNFL